MVTSVRCIHKTLSTHLIKLNYPVISMLKSISLFDWYGICKQSDVKKEKKVKAVAQTRVCFGCAKLIKDSHTLRYKP